MNDLASKFGSVEDFNELVGILQKEMQKTAYPQSTTTTADIIQIDYDAEIQKKEIREAPFLAFLEAKGRVQTTSSAVIGWRNKENANASSFIAELGPIADYGGKEWTKETANMKTIIYPISTSIMAQMGNQSVDLVDDDRQDGYLDISARKDKAMLLGDHTVDANSFDGINKMAPSQNKEDLNGAEITMADVDAMIDNVIAQGSNPDCLVTTARVTRQLTTEQQLENILNDKVEFVPGGWTRSYYTPNGEIPIITDRNLVTYETDGSVDSASEDILAVVDSSGLINKNLLPVSEFPLAMTKLTNDSVLATFTAFGVMRPEKQGIIGGIGIGA